MIATEIQGTIPAQTRTHAVWNFKKARISEMQSVLRDINWGEILTSDIETDWNFF